MAITTESRFDDFERRIRLEFLAFNAETTRQLLQFIDTDFINYGALQQNFRPQARQFAAELVNIMILGSNLSANQTSQDIGRTISFNAAGGSATATFRELSNRVVGMLVDQQTAALAEMQRIAQTITPIRTAAQIRTGLTLTARQHRAIANFRGFLEDGSSEALTRELRDKRFDNTVRRAIAGETALTGEQIDRMVGRYSERQLRFRANTIAATEAVRIANESDDLFFRQAVEDGDIQVDSLQRQWVTSQDEKVRTSHRSLNGQIRPLGEAFRSGAGNQLRFPGDPRAPATDTINCRCFVKTDIDASEIDRLVA